MEALVMTMEPYFTISEVAEMVRVSARTVSRWIRDGKMRAVEIPGRGKHAAEYRVPKSALVDWGFNFEESKGK